MRVARVVWRVARVVWHVARALRDAAAEAPSRRGRERGPVISMVIVDCLARMVLKTNYIFYI